MRVYFCKFVGSGSDDDPYHITIMDHIAHASVIGVCDIRRDASLAAGYAVVWCVPTLDEHSAIISDPNCIYITHNEPLPVGIPTLADDASDVSMIINLLRQRGVDVSGLSAASTVMDVLHLAFPGMQ